MASITVVQEIKWDTTAAKAQAALDKFCRHHGYQATITNPDGTTSPNPETKNQFKQRMIIKFFKDSIKTQDAIDASESARQAAIDAIESDMVLV